MLLSGSVCEAGAPLTTYSTEEQQEQAKMQQQSHGSALGWPHPALTEQDPAGDKVRLSPTELEVVQSPTRETPQDWEQEYLANCGVWEGSSACRGVAEHC